MLFVDFWNSQLITYTLTLLYLKYYTNWNVYYIYISNKKQKLNIIFIIYTTQT